jgi:hypothetical protein
MNWMQRGAAIIVFGIAGSFVACLALLLLVGLAIAWSDAPNGLRWTWAILFGLLALAGVLGYLGNKRAA